MEGKRRLPPWMVGAPTADKASESLDEDTTVTECRKPKSKSRKGKQGKQVCLPSDDTSFLVKCDTKRKKRELVECDDGVQQVVRKRKSARVGRKVAESDPSTKKKEFESCDENNEDLTMDDMLTIAGEFVENDSDMGQQRPLQGQRAMDLVTERTSPVFSGSPMCEDTSSHHNSVENLTSKATLGVSRMTGDPAQDMLDLFLGPLLKKPVVKEGAGSIAEDIMLSHDVENENQQHDKHISNKAVPLTKKKSSLRDAVTKLLD